MKNGQTITLVLRPGRDLVTGQEFERTVTGKVRSFEQDGETRWEILTGDPHYPAIGFDPETAETK